MIVVVKRNSNREIVIKGMLIKKEKIKLILPKKNGDKIKQ